MLAALAVTGSLIVAFCAGWALGAVFVTAVVAGAARSRPTPFRPGSYWG
jgi:hypothetical protein